jgi:tellurite resistance protein TerC
MLALDLFVFGGRKSHRVSVREALAWVLAWTALALIFAGLLWWYLHERFGAEIAHSKTLEFLTGFLIEQSLSIDNMFVFILIFAYFHVSAHDQPRVLKWGILGALVMRLVLILAGVALLEAFHWIIYVFGALLIFTGIRMAAGGEQRLEPDKNPVVKAFRRLMPVTAHHESGGPFFVRARGRWHATPLLITVLVVEASDLVFAIDSIPAVLAISHDPFIVYTSNAFAILGLRALYFLLSGIVGMFRYLKLGVSVVLVYVGIKMLLSHVYTIPILVSLGIVGGILALSILASLIRRGRSPEAD